MVMVMVMVMVHGTNEQPVSTGQLIRPQRRPGKELPVCVGQVEREPDGSVWAAVYLGESPSPETLARRERVESPKAGMRRVIAMISEQVDLESKGRRW